MRPIPDYAHGDHNITRRSGNLLFQTGPLVDAKAVVIGVKPRTRPQPGEDPQNDAMEFWANRKGGERPTLEDHPISASNGP
jgi:hypothetical protein